MAKTAEEKQKWLDALIREREQRESGCLDRPGLPWRVVGSSSSRGRTVYVGIKVPRRRVLCWAGTSVTMLGPGVSSQLYHRPQVVSWSLTWSMRKQLVLSPCCSGACLSFCLLSLNGSLGDGPWVPIGHDGEPLSTQLPRWFTERQSRVGWAVSCVCALSYCTELPPPHPTPPLAGNLRTWVCLGQVTSVT